MRWRWAKRAGSEVPVNGSKEASNALFCLARSIIYVNLFYFIYFIKINVREFTELTNLFVVQITRFVHVYFRNIRLLLLIRKIGYKIIIILRKFALSNLRWHSARPKKEKKSYEFRARACA
jgi:hypothetical protein